MSTANRTIDAVARVYAQSLFELGEAAGGDAKLVEIGDELQGIVEIVRGDSTFAEFLRSPIVEREKRAETLRRVFDGQVTDVVLRFLLVLNDKGRLGSLDDIADGYGELLNERFGRIEVDVYTVDGALDPSQIEQLAGKVKARLGKDPVFHQYADPSMIGGLVLRIGDQLIDGSVRGQLRDLRESLLENGSTSIRSDSGDFLEE